jgi:hypothetical protein
VNVFVWHGKRRLEVSNGLRKKPRKYVAFSDIDLERFYTV